MNHHNVQITENCNECKNCYYRSVVKNNDITEVSIYDKLNMHSSVSLYISSIDDIDKAIEIANKIKKVDIGINIDLVCNDTVMSEFQEDHIDIFTRYEGKERLLNLIPTYSYDRTNTYDMSIIDTLSLERIVSTIYVLVNLSSDNYINKLSSILYNTGIFSIASMSNVDVIINVACDEDTNKDDIHKLRTIRSLLHDYNIDYGLRINLSQCALHVLDSNMYPCCSKFVETYVWKNENELLKEGCQFEEEHKLCKCLLH